MTTQRNIKQTNYSQHLTEILCKFLNLQVLIFRILRLKSKYYKEERTLPKCCLWSFYWFFIYRKPQLRKFQCFILCCAFSHQDQSKKNDKQYQSTSVNSHWNRQRSVPTEIINSLNLFAYDENFHHTKMMLNSKWGCGKLFVMKTD